MAEDKEKKPDETAEKPAAAKEAVTIPFGRKRASHSAAPEPKKDVAEFAKSEGMPGWELAALRQAKGWADGKQVTGAEFNKALRALRGRVQGGGKI